LPAKAGVLNVGATARAEGERGDRIGVAAKKATLYMPTLKGIRVR
jgi:hypothetical protein